MKKVKSIILALSVALFISSCTTQHYAVKSVEVTRILADTALDAAAGREMTALVNSYKMKMDEEMKVVIGKAAREMHKGMPQGLLSNFAADAVRAYSTQLWGEIDFAVLNNGGMRTNLNEGLITVGSVYEIFPFENTLVMLELPGKAVREFFNFVANNRGEALSDNIELVIKDRKTASLKIGGKPLDESKTYKVATIDYLAEGNDRMTALTKASVSVPTDILLRDVIISYIKQLTSKNQLVDAKLDNRITIEE
ncbi:MAG: 5'-nucleotidase C-terminal domain-containing protein [Dysgonamonadaceae bacterium]|jgi:2',3'-cyclic-nucleotide 2'-phosphodiesterase (5'-nucleotidase family)|nr:5'-nucleotidase C-terminal domain-containing protein [Dysgonamonadaceae bacterium]